MNLELIKHIVRSELKMGRPLLIKAYTLGLGLVFLLKILPKENELRLLLMFFGFLLLVVSMGSSSIFHSNSMTNNTASQSGSFSWKYLHSIVHDRKSFLIGYGLGGVALSGPFIIFAFGACIIQNLPIQYFFISFIPFCFFIIFLRMSHLITAIQYPRKTYYRYNAKEGLISWILGGLKDLHRGLHYLALAIIPFAVCVLLISLEFRYLAIIAIGISFFFFTILAYRYTLRIWADERASRWESTREGKKTSVYVMVVIVVAMLTYSFRDYLGTPEGKVFNLVREGKLEELKKIRITKNILQSRNDYHRTPLLEAVRDNHFDIVDYFLEKGASLNEKIEGEDRKNYMYLNGMNSLMYAINYNNIAMVKHLLSKGAEPEVSNDGGMSALSFAGVRCIPKIMEMLVKSGAEINKTYKNGLSPLFYTTHGRGCITGLLYLKKIGADTSLKNSEGFDYLEYAKNKNIMFYNELMFYKNKLNN